MLHWSVLENGILQRITNRIFHLSVVNFTILTPSVQYQKVISIKRKYASDPEVLVRSDLRVSPEEVFVWTP